MISARKLVFFLLFNAAGVAFATDSSTSSETSTTKTDSAINTSVEKQSKSKASETAREDAKKKDVKTPIESSSSEEQALTVIEIKTSKGTIKLQLDGKAAPITAKNFISYVKDKHYDDTVFHRVIDGFMIQGGGFRLEGHNLVEKETKNPITNEAKNGLKNVRGSIAMARTADPNSATAQFFINLVDNARLDYPYPDGNGYAVFGKVVEGMDIVDKIAKVKTGFKSGMADVPTEDVKIVSMTVVEKAP